MFPDFFRLLCEVGTSEYVWRVVAGGSGCVVAEALGALGALGAWILG